MSLVRSVDRIALCELTYVVSALFILIWPEKRLVGEIPLTSQLLFPRVSQRDSRIHVQYEVGRGKASPSRGLSKDGHLEPRCDHLRGL